MHSRVAKVRGTAARATFRALTGGQGARDRSESDIGATNGTGGRDGAATHFHARGNAFSASEALFEALSGSITIY